MAAAPLGAPLVLRVRVRVRVRANPNPNLLRVRAGVRAMLRG